MNSFDEIQVEECFCEVQVGHSGCCDEILDDTHVEYEICPGCGEHCEVDFRYEIVRL